MSDEKINALGCEILGHLIENQLVTVLRHTVGDLRKSGVPMPDDADDSDERFFITWQEEAPGRIGRLMLEMASAGRFNHD